MLIRYRAALFRGIIQRSYIVNQTVYRDTVIRMLASDLRQRVLREIEDRQDWIDISSCSLEYVYNDYMQCSHACMCVCVCNDVYTGL